MQDDSDKMLAFELEQIAQGGPLAFNKATILEAIDRLSALQAKLDAVLAEVHHVKRWNHRLIELLSAIHMRCAPEDIKLEDGRTMRFVPPDPEFYWRELSAKVKAVEAEMHAINEAEQAALTDQGRAGEVAGG